MALENETYTVLARKYRPQRFDEVIGQEHVTVTLRNAIAQDRVGQGYLFIGTRGVGKTTIARILAKALNCANRDKETGEPCCQCPNCTAIRDGNCLDVVEIDGASNRGVDEIRRLRDTVAVAPVNAAFKIYIIDEVHMLTKEAFNALLKTLEEPPPHVKFFFATTDPHEIPLTVLSRVQKFELKRVPWQRLVEYLAIVAKNEGVDIEPAAVAVVAHAGNGSVRDALSVLDQVLALSDAAITEENVVTLLGITDKDVYADIHRAIVAGDTQLALASVQRVIEKGRDPLQFVLGLISLMRSLLVVRSTSTPENVLEEPPETVAFLKDAAAQYSTEQLLYSIDVLMELIPRLEATEAKQTALELAVMKLLYARKRVSMDELLARLEAIEKGGMIEDAPAARYHSAPASSARPAPARTPGAAHARAAEAPAPPAPSAPPGEPAANATEAAWRGWLEHAEKSEPMLASLVKSAQAGFGTAGTVSLVFQPDDVGADALGQKKNMNRLLESLAACAGRPIAVKVSVAKPAAAHTKPKTQDDLREQAKKMPLVKKALEQFPGSKLTHAEE